LDHIEDVAAVLNRERWLGYEVVGALASDSDEEETRSGIPIFGCPEDTVEVLGHTGANAVVFAEGSFRSGRDFNLLARELQDAHAQTIVVPSLTDISAQRMDIRPVAGIPLVHIEQPRASSAGHAWKRLFDLIGSSFLILLGSPLLLAVALAVKSDGGPILFRQVRAGHHGEPFEMFKFRSMVVDAEERLKQLQAHNNSDGVLFKMVDDPRITRVGKFIRRYSLDELPQLFNVWLGHMSLVGPRPALLTEVAEYKDHVRRRLDVRPGMTGLWQVSGRSDLSWDDTVRLDLYYVDNWSMVQDLSILLRTFGAVVGKRGAY
ncbi:MAG: sugar transferase, partial [Propionibacteriaceae bacterium]|nr:sugar transferase [Propionibacteriaceae bacterium]